MRKKIFIELIIYIMLVVVGICLLFSYKPKERPITIPSDFQIEEGGRKNAAIPGQ